MKGNSGGERKTRAERDKSHFADGGNHAETLGFPEVRRGLNDPEDYPRLDSSEFPLGDAMDIDEVAELFGCSAWTVRQKYVRQGLPCLRTARTGKFVFFRRQVLDWILKQQRKEEWK